MTTKRAVVSVVAGGLTALAFVTIAQASPEAAEAAGGGHGGHGGLGGLNWFELKDEHGRPGMIYVIINFVVLLFILNKILFKNLRAGHREKRNHIKLELDRAGEARAKAETLIEELEGRLAAIDKEEKRILADAKSAAAAEGKRIVEEANEEADKIKRAAIASAEREAMNRVQRLENEIITRAIDKAEATIRGQFGEPDQRRMIDEYAAEVAGADLKAS